MSHDDRIEIKLLRCRLVLYENELLLMLREHPDIWQQGLRRGKGVIRARQAEARTPRRVS
jgi:hypothetical protein